MIVKCTVLGPKGPSTGGRKITRSSGRLCAGEACLLLLAFAPAGGKANSGGREIRLHNNNFH